MAHEGKRHGFAGSGNSQIYTTGSVADKLSELKANETSFLKFKPLSSMTVDAGQVSTFVQKLDVEKSNVGVNAQHYDNNDVPNLSILNEEINTGNAGYTSNVGDELISKEGGIQYQEIGHTDAYKDAVEATKQKLKTARVEDKRQNDRIENIAKASDDQAYVDNSRRLAAELQKKDKINESAFEREQEIKKRVNKLKKEEKAKADSAARLKKINDKTAEIAATAAAQKAKRDEKAVEKEIAEFEDDLKKSLKYDEQARQITEEQRATDLENANRLAFQDGLMLEQDKVVDGIVTGGNTTGSASDSSQSQYEIANQRAVAVAKEAEQDAINGTTAKDMTTTVRELAAERAEKERQKQIQNSIDNEQSTNAENKTRLSAEQREKDIKQRTSALQREKDVDERAAKLVAEEKAKKEKRLHEQQINNADANADFSKTDTSPDLSARRGTGGLNRGELRKKMAENKANQIAEAQNTSENNFQADDNFSTQQGLLAGDPYAFSTLSYPSDVTNNNENGHYVLFYVNVQNKTKYEYLGLEGGNYVSVGGMIERKSEEGKDFNPKSVFTKRKGYESVADVSYQEQQIANGAKGSKFYNNMTTLQRSRKAPLSGINSRYPTTTRITDSVALYLPPGIGNSLSANYGDFATGVAGYLALSGLDVVSKLQQNDFVGAATDLFGVSGRLLTEAAKKLAVGALETFTGSEGIQQTFDKAFGQTLNPYMEVAYNSMGMRTFDYTFKFAPKSRKESDEAKAIIQLFRFHMAPEMIDDAHRYLTLPSTFDIHYMYQSGSGDAAIAKENSFYNKIATCVLTGVDVNYTPNDGVKSFADGAPTEIALTLNFKETEMLTKQKINDGF